jgi:hypothetical protein
MNFTVLLNDLKHHLGEFVPLGKIVARVFELIETAGLAFHRAAILPPGCVPLAHPQAIRHRSPGDGGVCVHYLNRAVKSSNIMGGESGKGNLRQDAPEPAVA